MDVIKTSGEKARLELHKNATSYFKQILEAIPHETTATFLLSENPSELDEHDMQDTAREVRSNL